MNLLFPSILFCLLVLLLTFPSHLLSLPTPHTTLRTPLGTYNYSDALHKSYLFYEAQRTGPYRGRVPWRGDSAMKDGADSGLDLTGGLFDAGDWVKFNLPQFFTAAILSWGVIHYEEGYERAGEKAYALDTIRWITDYLIKCHPSPHVLYGQVGSGELDHALWGRPEQLTTTVEVRPSWQINETAPGSDLAGEAAAATAAASIAFRGVDDKYSALLLTHAIDLFEFAYHYRGYYSRSIPDAGHFYGSSFYYDELAWGALWMYRATHNHTYLTIAEDIYHTHNLSNHSQAFSWGDKSTGVTILLATLTNHTAYHTAAQAYLDYWLPGGGVLYSPKGLAFGGMWGSLRTAANQAFLALIYSSHLLLSHPTSPRALRYQTFAINQLHYALGDTGFSFMVGFGASYPQRPHHRAASCPRDASIPCNMTAINNTKPNELILYGGLVGGPFLNDSYQDVHVDFVRNEVALDYSACFTGVLSAAVQLAHRQAQEEADEGVYAESF